MIELRRPFVDGSFAPNRHGLDYRQLDAGQWAFFPISPQSRWDLLTYGLKTISARIASTATAAP
jgi:hypothetical protein